MVQIRGYSEDEVEFLSQRLSDEILAALRRVAVKTSEQLTPAKTASAAFHLPGKHDQSTHGRGKTGGSREVKVLEPYGDWGGQGKRPWMASSNPDERANGMWSDTYEGQQAIMQTMHNIHAGQTDPTSGVDTSSGPLRQQSKVFNYDTDEEYGDEAVKADVFNAATNLDARLEAAPTVSTPLYRGMRVEDAESRLQVGSTFDSDVSSWSSSQSVATQYSRPGMSPSAPSGGTPVIMRMEGGQALNLDDGSLGRLTGSGEHLVRGTFEITSVSQGPSGLEVVVRQV